MYAYISRNEIDKMFNSGREGFVIPLPKIEYIDEVLNVWSDIMENSYGLKKEMFLQPRVMGNKTVGYNIIFILRDSSNKIPVTTRFNIRKFMEGNGFSSFADFVRKLYISR